MCVCVCVDGGTDIKSATQYMYFRVKVFLLVTEFSRVQKMPSGLFGLLVDFIVPCAIFQWEIWVGFLWGKPAVTEPHCPV